MRNSGTDRIWLAALASLLLIAIVGTSGALSQVGKSFPGFLVLGNRVIASVGLSIWPATAGGEIFQHEVVAIDGMAVTNAETLRSQIRSLPAGTAIEYRLRSGDVEIARSIETRTFGWRDFALLHGMYLVNGLCRLRSATRSRSQSGYGSSNHSTSATR